MKSKILSVFIAVWFIFALPLMVSAESFNPEQYGTLTVTLQDQGKPIAGAELSVYYVATVEVNGENNLIYAYTDNFEDCGIKIDNPSLTETLNTFVVQNAVEAAKIVTNAEGKAVLDTIPLGLYLVKQTNSVAGYAPCDSFLVKVPYKVDDTFVYNVQAAPKTDIERLTNITIKKVWNTDKSAQATDSVQVQLLRDGVVVETATLSILNNWQVTFTNMPQSDSYSVVEVNVPKGFTATYSRNGYDFTVTNSASLIDTGKLVWPVPILAMAGIVFITTGAVVLKKSGEYDE